MAIIDDCVQMEIRKSLFIDSSHCSKLLQNLNKCYFIFNYIFTFYYVKMKIILHLLQSQIHFHYFLNFSYLSNYQIENNLECYC